MEDLNLDTFDLYYFDRHDYVSITCIEDLERKKDTIAKSHFVDFNCNTTVATQILSKLPASVKAVHLGWGITSTDYHEYIERFLLAIPASVSYLRLTIERIDDKVISTLLYGIPSIRSIRISGLQKAWMDNLLRRMDQSLWFGFSTLIIDLGEIESTKHLERIIPRLRGLSIHDYDSYDSNLNHQPIIDRISRSGLLVRYEFSGDYPIVPTTIPPTLRYLSVLNRYDSEGRYLQRLTKALRKPGWSLDTLDIQDNQTSEERRSRGTFARNVYEAIRPSIRGMRTLRLHGHIDSRASDVSTLISDPACTLSELTVDIYMDYDEEEEDEAIHRLLFTIRGSSNIVNLNLRRVRESETICAFEYALESTWFRAIQVLLSARFVPRLRGDGLAWQIPWENYIHTIARTIWVSPTDKANTHSLRAWTRSWNLDDLYLHDKTIRNMYEEDDEDTYAGANFEDVSDAVD